MGIGQTPKDAFLALRKIWPAISMLNLSYNDRRHG